MLKLDAISKFYRPLSTLPISIPQCYWPMKIAISALLMVLLGGCAANMAEARSTAVLSTTPPVEISNQSCAGLNDLACAHELESEFSEISSFWSNQINIWKRNGVDGDAEGQELIDLAERLSQNGRKAAEMFHSYCDGEPRVSSELVGLHQRFVGRHFELRKRMADIAVQRLALRSAAESERIRRAQIIQGVVDRQYPQKLDVTVHQQ